MAKKGRYRVFKAGALHHIYQRTYDGFLIFYSVRDFLVFFTLFCTIARKCHIRVLGVCLMYDHIHVLVAAPSKKDLSAFVQEYTCRFSRQRNVQYQRKGSFFQRRFGSAPKSGEKKARTAIAYLYNNPVEKKLCKNAEDYQWDFLTYANNSHPFSQPLKLNGASRPMRRAVAEIKSLRATDTPLNYATIERIIKDLSPSEIKQLTDYTVSSFNCIDYQGVETNAFPIDKNIYSDKWHPSMDISLVVNMDHMEVNEAYRIWHGRANMDDALQAPLHDGYTQGSETNTKYQPLEHIPGLAVGGWYDAGDFDIQANSVLTTTTDLGHIWTDFRPMRDQTLIDEKTQYADIHVPDGIPDNVQLIMHGTLNINAQIENIGFVAQVIGQPDMHHYHHLGDAMTLTDGKIYDPSLARYEVKGDRSGTPDDRFVFTSRFSPAGVMSDIVSLASAYPALKEYFPEEAERSLKNALMLWNKYFDAAAPNANAAPAAGRRGGMGGDPRLNAAIELWFATGDQKYKDFFLPLVEAQLEPRPAAAAPAGAPAGFAPAANLTNALRIYPYMDKKFQDKVKALVPDYVKNLTTNGRDNPYGVAITGATWAGNGGVINTAYNCYKIWKLFPDMIDPEFVLAGLNYIFGCHPYTNVSFVTAVGVNTKKVAYSNNRADYSVIPGGIVPGLLVKEDFYENKDDYPFHWGENECCINTAPQYVQLCLAADEVVQYLNK